MSMIPENIKVKGLALINAKDIAEEDQSSFQSFIACFYTGPIYKLNNEVHYPDSFVDDFYRLFLPFCKKYYAEKS